MKKYDGYALITGGSSGIGLEFARELAVQGYNLVLVSKDEPELRQSEAILRRDYKVDVISIHIDLAELDSASRIFDQLQKEKIHVGLLVNNAGFAAHGFFHEIELEKHLDLIKVMCLNLTELTYRFLPAMLARGAGGIILIASIGALLPLLLSGVYGAAKGFIYNFGLSLHAEYTAKGIDILTVCPGWVDTNIFKIANYKVPSTIPLMTPQYVAQKSLNALGKDIVLTLTGRQIDVKIMLFLRNVLSYKLIEKLAIKGVKDTVNIDLS